MYSRGPTPGAASGSLSDPRLQLLGDLSATASGTVCTDLEPHRGGEEPGEHWGAWLASGLVLNSSARVSCPHWRVCSWDNS